MIQRAGDLDPGSFLADFLSLNRPVIVRGAELFGGDRASLSRAWSPSSLSKIFGQHVFSAVNVPYARNFVGGVSTSTTLERFVAGLKKQQQQPASEARYLFDGGITQEQQMALVTSGMPKLASVGPHHPFAKVPSTATNHSHARCPCMTRCVCTAFALKSDVVVVSGSVVLQAVHPGVFQFYLGGAGSGSPTHWHNDAINYAVVRFD
jgi:hypothetical protein